MRDRSVDPNSCLQPLRSNILVFKLKNNHIKIEIASVQAAVRPQSRVPVMPREKQRLPSRRIHGTVTPPSLYIPLMARGRPSVRGLHHVLRAGKGETPADLATRSRTPTQKNKRVSRRI